MKKNIFSDTIRDQSTSSGQIQWEGSQLKFSEHKWISTQSITWWVLKDTGRELHKEIHKDTETTRGKRPELREPVQNQYVGAIWWLRNKPAARNLTQTESILIPWHSMMCSFIMLRGGVLQIRRLETLLGPRIGKNLDVFIEHLQQLANISLERRIWNHCYR